MNAKTAIATALTLACASTQAPPGDPMDLSDADEVAIFETAGFRREGEQWRVCEDADDDSTYSPGRIEPAGDLDGDGLPEVIVSESSQVCYGMMGTLYVVVSKRPDGDWSGMLGGTGIPSFLSTRGVDGWPDIEVGGPGFCFPVLRWNGEAYEHHRYEYDGEPCEPR